MKLVYLIIFLILIIFILFMVSNKDKFVDKYAHLSIQEKNEIIRQNDIKLQNTYSKATFTKLLDNNKKTIEEINQKPKQLKIAFITFEDRDEEYIKLHHQNVKSYCDKWGYEYIHSSDNTNGTSPYWFKIFLVQKILLTNKYDYVFWMDSDTVINNFNIDLGKDILHLYNSDIFLAPDNMKLDISNAGLFVIKNSEIGKQFLDDWTNEYLPMCERGNGKLKGRWAMSCYEQGIMNKLIDETYGKYTTFLDKNIFYNKNACLNSVFITHYYGSNKEQRAKCFRKAPNAI